MVSDITVKVFPIAIGTDTGISLQQMKSVTAASTDFSDFQNRIAAL